MIQKVALTFGKSDPLLLINRRISNFHALNTWQVPGTVLGSGNRGMNKIDVELRREPLGR